MADDQGAEQKDSEDQASSATPAPDRSQDGATPTSADIEADLAADGAAKPEVEAAGAEAEPEAKSEPETEPETEAKEEREPKAAAEAKAEPDPKPAPKPSTVRRRASRLWWALPILMVIEFYVYGHNGRLEICVGKEGDTDFSLVGQERTDANRWKFPRCETRENLGLRSQHDAKVKEGIEAACRGATIFRHQGEAKVCVAGEQGWQHRVEGRFVPPWDPAYYRHLFWFLQ